MNAATTFSADQAAGSERTYGCTFGSSKDQTAPWTDVKYVTWPRLCQGLTSFAIGPKEGRCIVPAVFRGTQRRKADAKQIDIAFLDCDIGHTLDEIRARVMAQGWMAIIHSTHSHLTAKTLVGRSNWDAFLRIHVGASPAADYLLEEKGYLLRVAHGAEVLSQDDQYVTLRHAPCPKFRVVIPLLEPWRADTYADQDSANAAWKERIEALAAALSLHHDQSCTDTSRLFYLPRRLADGPEPETAILAGDHCDLFALPAAASETGQRQDNRHARPDDVRDHTDPDTGEVLDLVAWAREFGRCFQMVDALRARRPGVFVGKLADGRKHHIRCVNVGQHTDPAPDRATIVINASESTSKGWVYHCCHDHCVGRDRLYFLRLMLEQGWLADADLRDPAFLTEPPPRPVIRYTAGELPEIVDQAEQALIAAEAGLYQRGTFVVRPGLAVVSVSAGRKVAARRAFRVGDRAVAEAMSKSADWQRFDKRSDSWVRIDAPMAVAETYQQRVGRWRLPTLTGLIDAPTLRADGTILWESGYDEETGLLLDTAGASFPAIAYAPTREDAKAALETLNDLLVDFPFISAADRAVALSAILTASIRRSLATAPMHAFTAPVAGSGKSLLVDLASVIATGREAGVIAQGRKEEELEKRLGALLLAGDAVIAIDNCEVPLASEFLCSMLTQQAVRPRILGKSEAPELPANAFVSATGNNLVLVGDLTRRAVLCRLDPLVERPELRTFARHPIQTVKADRGRYLVAALTVLRAFHVAGRPQQSNPLGSFESWNWVRDSLLWLGASDPADTMEQLREQDPQLDDLNNVLVCWQQVLGTARVSVRDIIECATQPAAAGAIGALAGRAQFRFPDLREALLTVAGDAGAINSRRLGRWIAANEKRVVAGVRLVRRGLNGGSMNWQLEQVGGT